MSGRARLVLIGLAAVVLLGTGVAIAGGEVSDKVRSGEEITVDAGEVVGHDLYVFGGTVTVDGTISGDLVVGAGTVIINGTVEGDLVVGAGQVSLLGDVGGDVRAGVGEISIGGTVGEDVLVGAGRLTIEDAGEIGEDLIFGAGDVAMHGAVTGSILGTASTYSRTGTVGGTEEVTLDRGPDPDDPGRPPPSEPVRVIGDGVRQFVAVVFFGALGLLLIPTALRASEGGLRRRPLASFGLGVGVLVGYVIQFIAVILLMILLAIAFGSVTLDALAGVSIWLGLIDLLVTTFALVVAASFVVDAIVGLALARLVTRDWAQNRWQELALLIGGALVVVVVTSLPGIGFIAKLAVVVFGLGAMAVALGEWWGRRHPPAAVTFPTAPPSPADPPPASPES